MRTNPLSILHIEDDPLWCEAVRLAVGALPGGGEYRQGATGSAGLELCRHTTPDVVLLDLRLPDGDGFDVARELARTGGCPPVIVLTARSDDAALLHIMQQPAIAGLLWKAGEALSRLGEALAEVRRGHRYYPPEVRAALRRFRADPRAFFKILSDREISLLPGLGRGLTDDELAAMTGLSSLTIKSHRQHIMAKLGLHRTPELIYWAIEHGFVDPPRHIGWVREEA